MALSSALFAGSSGLSTLGDTMQIIGDNIANVNTIGFKSSKANFQDLLSQSVSTMNGTAQVGSGSAIGDVSASFEQGSFETTGNATDLAIGGDGFFVLRETNGVGNYYSRAGNFGFDEDGYMANPNGYVVQGWELDEATGNDVGSITDIHLNSFTSNPKESSAIQLITNLDSDGIDNSLTAPLEDSWDGSSLTAPYMTDGNYEYQTTIEVYDSLGSAHDITVYFDKTDPATDSIYEYVITCNPDEDKRTTLVPPLVPPSANAGLLGKGTLVFEPASGIITDITMTDIDGAGTPTVMTTAADLTKDGTFAFNADFLGGSAMSVGLDFGSAYDQTQTSWVNDSLSTTQFAVASNTTYKTSDGYAAGELQDINVDEEGVITGTYSNGQTIPLYRVALADFQNEDGLVKEGGNMFSATLASGGAITNKPGTNGLGSISPGALEQSNVDIADEFVKMITTQRGYQANSKIITTVDSMLSELMNLKR